MVPCRPTLTQHIHASHKMERLYICEHHGKSHYNNQNVTNNVERKKERKKERKETELKRRKKERKKEKKKKAKYTCSLHPSVEIV